MIKPDLIEPIERLGQFISELQLLSEIQDKILGAELSKGSAVIERVYPVTIETVSYLSSIISNLSREIAQELKPKIDFD